MCELSHRNPPKSPFRKGGFRRILEGATVIPAEAGIQGGVEGWHL